MKLKFDKKKWRRPVYLKENGSYGAWNDRVDKLLKHFVSHPKDYHASAITHLLLMAYPIDIQVRIENIVVEGMKKQFRNNLEGMFCSLGVDSKGIYTTMFDSYGFLTKLGIPTDDVGILQPDSFKILMNEFLGSEVNEGAKLSETHHSMISPLKPCGIRNPDVNSYTVYVCPYIGGTSYPPYKMDLLKRIDPDGEDKLITTWDEIVEHVKRSTKSLVNLKLVSLNFSRQTRPIHEELKAICDDEGVYYDCSNRTGIAFNFEVRDADSSNDK